VLREDYSAGNFVDGPLLEAMREGGFLYIEEFNRAPEDTLNTLLTAMAERSIALPRAGVVVAKPTFRVIASMNPYDNVGTTRLATSVHDRLCRLAVTYQDEDAERGIVTLRAPLPGLEPARCERLVADAVVVTRATRTHEDIRQGSSVRGAIDLTPVAGQLLSLSAERPGRSAQDEARYREVVYDAMVVALSGRIFLDETVEATAEQVLRQIWEDHFILSRRQRTLVEELLGRTRRCAGPQTRLGSTVPPTGSGRCAAARRCPTLSRNWSTCRGPAERGPCCLAGNKLTVRYLRHGELAAVRRQPTSKGR
jgi:MoxR-like ATPase